VGLRNIIETSHAPRFTESAPLSFALETPSDADCGIALDNDDCGALDDGMK
jgi:hypothetical protein